MEIFIEEATDRVLSETGNTYADVLPIRRKLTYYDVYKNFIIYDNMVKVSDALDLTPDIVEKIAFRVLTPLHSDKPKGVKWGSWLLSLIEYKKCRECSKILPLASFSKDSLTWDLHGYVCKECRAIQRQTFTDNNPEYNKQHYLSHKDEYIARAIQYKTKRSLATPPWADLLKIKQIYDTCPKGYHVDHIIPLQGELVSGLHVEYNLRHLLALENMQKHNTYHQE
jgi:hypothetical protein